MTAQDTFILFDVMQTLLLIIAVLHLRRIDDREAP